METVATTKPSLIVRIPSPIWLIALIIAALALDALLGAPAVAQYRPAGGVLILAGTGLCAWAFITFRRLRAQIKPHSEVHATLVASGPFSLSRNPMYLGNLVIGIGAALVSGTLLMWLVPIVVFLLDELVIIPFEERSVERTFGDAFRAYKARVRRWI
jgi:protein-S-isoprenylcysteine O-methyltransferase Ste14